MPTNWRSHTTASAISTRFTSPLKLFEYMACGAPVVASALGQIVDVIAEGETGLTHPAGELDALVDACHRLLADPALASRLRQDLEDIFDGTFQSFLDWLASVRESVQGSESDAERRRNLLRDAVSGFKLSGTIQYPKAWLDEKARARS